MTTLTSAPASVRTAVTADPTLPGTLALTGLTLAAAVGMGRLFADASYLVPFVAAALVPHAVCWTGRRLGASLPVTVLVALAALVLAAAWMVLPETTIFGIPWTGTLRSARLALSAAASQFADVVAPTEVTEGFLLAGMIGVGLAAILGDWGAFRVRALFEAAIPSFTLFIFTATLGASRHRGISVALYLAALLLFLLVQQAWLQSASASWFASRSASRLGPRLRGGAAVGGVAVVAALVIGPNLPGADRPPVLAWRGSAAGAGGRTTVSPLVDIRGRLVDQSDVEVFRVRSNVRAYWRLTSLDRFDGEIWSSNDTHRPVDQRLPGDDVTAARRERAVQDFTITGLSSIWLPAAYEPERVEGVDDVSYNDELSSLITRKETSDGLTYRVESSLPRFGADELRQGAPVLAGRSLDRFLRLPAISPAVRGLARQAAGTGTAFQKARALQDFFQRRFTYDLEARPGHDQRALENFLFRTKRGYCEQFAGAYAVMARTIGLPTRVAVGFTPGEPGQDGRYHVRDLNAHAWPEVHLQGFGWVAFEPTPGRGAPGAEAYTGLPEAQAQVDDPSTATTLGPSAATSPPAAAAPGEDPGGEEPGVATTVPSGADEGGPGQR
ncbi:MAG: transglutaminaseTgpA domain-containing protein, partial [Actinomycetota bacterium]|nr:transglutaminaseTgpA domain-containing protein [Actinomycetota bacterium]